MSDALARGVFSAVLRSRKHRVVLVVGASLASVDCSGLRSLANGSQIGAVQYHARLPSKAISIPGSMSRAWTGERFLAIRPRYLLVARSLLMQLTVDMSRSQSTSSSSVVQPRASHTTVYMLGGGRTGVV